MAHGDAREGKWRGNWRMEWVASTLHTNSQHGVSSITTADAHTSAASSRLNWCPRRFKWTPPFRRKTKRVFCACVITFQTQSTPVTFLSRVTSVSVGAVGKLEPAHCCNQVGILQKVVALLISWNLAVGKQNLFSWWKLVLWSVNIHPVNPL